MPRKEDGNFQCLDQARPLLSYLLPMGQREPLNQRFAAPRKLQQHLPAVLLAARARDQPPRFQAIAQFHGTVMAYLHSLRETTNGCFSSIGKAFHREQSLMLF